MTRLLVATGNRGPGYTSVDRHRFERISWWRRSECKHCYLAESSHALYDRTYGLEWWTEARPLDARRPGMLERVFVFCLPWLVCGVLLWMWVTS